MRHVHAEIIHAWAEGATIECRNKETGRWQIAKLPSWISDVIYRIKPEPDPYAELKAAAKDPMKQVRLKCNPWPKEDTLISMWAYPPEDYEIRDKPKAKVKMWLWVLQGNDGKFITSSYFYETAPVIDDLKVIQRLDWSMIEVEEP